MLQRSRYRAITLIENGSCMRLWVVWGDARNFDWNYRYFKSCIDVFLPLICEDTSLRVYLCMHKFTIVFVIFYWLLLQFTQSPHNVITAVTSEHWPVSFCIGKKKAQRSADKRKHSQSFISVNSWSWSWICATVDDLVKVVMRMLTAWNIQLLSCKCFNFELLDAFKC